MSTRRPSVHVLDQFAFYIGDGPVPISVDDQLMLALLIAAGDNGCDRAEAARQLWNEELTEARDAELSEQLEHLRAIYPGLIDEVGSRYRLALPTDAVDLWLFFEQASNDDTDWSTSENLRLLNATSVFPEIDKTDIIELVVNRFHQVRREVVSRQERLVGQAIPGWLSALVNRLNTDGDGAGVGDEGDRPGLPPTLAAANLGFVNDERRRLVRAAVASLIGGAEIPPLLLVGGERGVGRTRTLALIAAELNQRGMAVRYVAGGDARGLATNSGRDAGAVGDLLAITESGATLVVIDDIEAFSNEAVSALLEARATRSGLDLWLAVAGLDDSAQMTGLRRDVLRRQSGTYLLLEPLDLTETIDLVGHHFPESSSLLRTSLARELQDRTGGIAADMAELLPTVSPATLLLDGIDDHQADGRSGAPTAPLSSEERRAAALYAGANRDYRRVVRLLTVGAGSIEQLPADLRLLLAEALHRTGADQEAARVRSMLVDEALSADDHLAALNASLVGLPEAERIDSDESRFQQLLAVNPDRLDAVGKFRRASALSRHATRLGQAEAARLWQGKAAELSQAADDRAQTAIGNWYTSILDTQPADRIPPVTAMLEQAALSEEWQARLLQVRAIDYYEDGRIERSLEDTERFGMLAERLEDRLRQWHHLTLQTMAAVDRGDWSRSAELQVDALAHANQHAIVEGQSLYIAQTFHDSWVKNQQGAFAHIFDQLPPDLADSRFGRAAMVSSSHAAGVEAEARTVGLSLIEEILDHPNQDSLAAFAMMAEFAAASSEPAMIESMVELLLPRSGSIIVVGSGVACFGPVDRYLYQLTGDPNHIEAAIATADQAELRLWQVKLRVESEVTGRFGHGFLRRQAEAIAAGTDLVALLDLR